jgi:excisionase family DNA binding protein
MPKPTTKYSNGDLPPSLLTIPEVARCTQVSAKTVYRWIQGGKLRAIQLGPRLYRIEMGALAAFLQASGHNGPALDAGNGKRGVR